VTRPDPTPQNARELYVAMERLGADPDLLAIIGSWGDTLDDAEILSMPRDDNATGKAVHRPHQPRHSGRAIGRIFQRISLLTCHARDRRPPPLHGR
jgi:hypothetical protein